ncbi:MAG: hypothetical protein V7K60_28850 [Nostoc sp.]
MPDFRNFSSPRLDVKTSFSFLGILQKKWFVHFHNLDRIAMCEGVGVARRRHR